MHRARPALIALALAPLVGCESTITGNEGNLRFSYLADEWVFDFNKPVAVGARLDLTVETAGTLEPVAVTAASFSDPAVLSVAEVAGDTVTIEGVGEGGARLVVEATTAAGEPVTDSVDLMARVPDVHRLSHTCGDDVAYLTGQDVFIPFDFELSDGRPVIGYGHYPVTASGDGQVTLDTAFDGSQYMKLSTDAAGTVTLTSDIDGSTLELVLVDEAEIDGVAEPVAGVLEDIDVGDVNPFFVRPRVGSRVVCQAQAAFTVQSETPEVCDVRRIEPLELFRYTYGWFEIEGLAAGECAYTVTYDDGTGSARFTHPIEP